MRSELPMALRDAQRLVQAAVTPLRVEHVSLRAALGRVLRAPILATTDAPPFDHSAVDGFALRASDLRPARPDRPVRLRIVGVRSAGQPADAISTHAANGAAEPHAAPHGVRDHATSPLGEGTAVRIMTGATLPAGADTVVPKELAQDLGDAILVRNVLPAGANVRRRGEELKAGEVVLREGSVVGPHALPLLAAFHPHDIPVAVRPRVAIVPTGDELVIAPCARGATQLVDVDTALVEGLVGAAGGDPWPRLPCRDDPDVLHDTLAPLLRHADVLVTTGGASVGDRDYVRQVFERLGLDTVFWGVAVKPGRPVGFARAGRILAFALPGNPAAVATTFELLVAPAIHALLGRADLPSPTHAKGLRGRLTEAVTPSRHFVRALRAEVSVCADQLRVTPLRRQRAGDLATGARAQTLALVPKGEAPIPAGTLVELEGALTLRHPRRPPFVQLVGYSNAGKTTLLVQLLEDLTARGLRLGALKHGHRFELDREGKDTDRMRRAGARSVGMAWGNGFAYLHDTEDPGGDEDPSSPAEYTSSRELASLLDGFPPDLDGILVEGWKSEPGPKIAVHRGDGPFVGDDPRVRGIIALVTDRPIATASEVASYDASDRTRLADLVARTLSEQARRGRSLDV